MAKYTVKMACGHEQIVELFGKSSERDKKIEYYEREGLCTECYKKMCEEQAKREGLVFNGSILPYINKMNGSLLISVWFSGDTKPHKDKIKALGYHWEKRKSANDFLSLKTVPLCWQKTIEIFDLEEETKKAISIGAQSLVSDKGLFAGIHAQIAIKARADWQEKQEKINAIQKPIFPSIIDGRRWNKKVYGKKGSYAIYLDGEKISVSDKEIEELQAYLKKQEAYLQEIEALCQSID